MTLSNHKALAAVVLWTICITTVHADARVPITSIQVASALASSGLRVTADQIEFLTPIAASKSNPRLSSSKIASLNPSTTKARLQCERTDVCLPFYVLIHWPESEKATQAMNNLSQTPHILLEPLMVHNGKAATLTFEGQNMRMTMPVLCLQNGVRGQRIRVISNDRKKVFLARVTGPGTLSSAVFNQ